MDMGKATLSSRVFVAALLALVLALRLLGATGYMPAVDRGALAIVVCPDADMDAPLAIDVAHHHHGHSKHKHGGQCPYASASALGALGPDFAALLTVLFAAAPLLGRSSFSLARNRVRERPPSQGPPLPA